MKAKHNRSCKVYPEDMRGGDVWYTTKTSHKIKVTSHVIQDNNDFYSHMRPMFLVMRLLGGIPFTADESGILLLFDTILS